MVSTTGKVLIFSKTPIAGAVKTRLSPVLPAEQCAQLQQRLITHMLDVCLETDLAVELWVAGDINHSFWSFCQTHYNTSIHAQHGCDLGERMFNALQVTLKNSPFAIIVGADCIALQSHHLIQTAELLQSTRKQPTTQCIIAPAEDGGYVLIGTNQADFAWFSNVAWGTPEVLEQTYSNLIHADVTWTELDTLWDIDRPADLQRLQNHVLASKLLDFDK